MKALHIFASVAVAMAVASCSSKPEISYMPAKADSGDNWGLVDANGNFLFEDEFSNRPSAVVNGIFYVEEGNGYTVYKADKTPKQIGDLCDLRYVGFYNCGVMPVVQKGEHVTFVDDDGQVKFTLDKVDGVNVKCVSGMFINDRCSFRTDEDKWGAIDKDGNVVIQPKYNSEFIFLDDLTAVADAESGEICIINKDGDVKSTLDSSYELRGVMLDGYVAVRQNNDESGSRYFMLKKDGELIKLPSSVKDVDVWNGDYIVYEGEDGNYGVMTMEGEITVRAKYKYIELLANGKFLGSRNDKSMYIDPKSGETESLGKGIYSAIRMPYVFSKVFDFGFELAKEDDDEEIELLSYSGKEIGKDMAKFRSKINIEWVYSDYYDYDAVANNVVEMFDAQGLKGYSFGSQMINYADSSHSVSWYRGDRSLSVTPEITSPYFSLSSATLRSDEFIVHDVSPEYYSYDWQFNPASRVDYFTVTLQFGYDDYRDELPEYIAKAIKAKFGVEAYVEGNEAAAADVSEYSYYPCKISTGYNTITISSGRYAWTKEEPADEAVDSVPDTVYVEDAFAPADTIAY